jgi:hypothetical protein
VIATYIVKDLGLFMKRMRQKRPQIVEQEFVSSRITFPSIQLLSSPTGAPPGPSGGSKNLPFRRGLAPADHFLFLLVKERLRGRTFTDDGPNTARYGVTATTPKEAFAAAYRRWFE